jgi:hypothetical protein
MTLGGLRQESVQGSIHACKQVYMHANSTCKHFSIPCKDEGHLRLLSLIPPPHTHGDPFSRGSIFTEWLVWGIQHYRMPHFPLKIHCHTKRPIEFSSVTCDYYSLLRSMPHLQSCEAQDKCFITVTCALRGNYLLTFVTQISQKLTFLLLHPVLMWQIFLKNVVLCYKYNFIIKGSF